MEEALKDNVSERISIRTSDIVYLFTKPDKIGIRFFNESGEESKDGIFLTNPKTVARTKWNSRINKVSGPQILKTVNGDISINTFIVSETVYYSIIDKILVGRHKDGLTELNINSEDLINKETYTK